MAYEHDINFGEGDQPPFRADFPAPPLLPTESESFVTRVPAWRLARRPTWDRDLVKEAALANLEGVLDELGIQLTGVVTNRGWLECHAFDRDDDRPSAGIDRETGVYNDLGEGGKSLSIFDLAVATGHYASFSEAVNGLGEFLGVPPKVGRSSITGAATRQGTPLRGGPNGKGEKSRGVSSKPKAVFSSVNEIARHLAYVLNRQGMRKLDCVVYPYLMNFQIIRCDGHDSLGKKRKEIRPVHRIGPGQWVYGDPPGLLPLCNLGGLTGNSPVLIVEGERCVVTLIDFGFPNATTSAHGAESARKSDWSKLPGRRFVILPDHDAGGERYAADVARLLASSHSGAEVRVLRLPGLAEGEDVVDWVAKGGTTEGLARLIVEAPMFAAAVNRTAADEQQKGGA